MTFTESNTVELMILNAATNVGDRQASALRERPSSGWGSSLKEELRPANWEHVPASQIPRQLDDVMVEPWVRDALTSLNAEVAAGPVTGPLAQRMRT